MYRAQHGRILTNSGDYWSLDEELSIRHSIAYVPGKPVLSSSTIVDNPVSHKL